jgi:uncharacterized protein
MDVKRASSLQKMLLGEWKSLTNEGREIKIEWDIMHMYSSAQIAKFLALKRGINPELAAIAAALHDIAVVETMKTENHDEIAESYVREAVERYNCGPGTKLPKITEEEVKLLVQAITRHSNKSNNSGDELTELLRDAYSIDRYLHGVKTEGAYMERCQKVMKEFGLVG